jgi:hypothetical protein
MEMACDGQASTQALQSMQSSLFTTAVVSGTEMALEGQASTHDLQALHFSASMTAGMAKLLRKVQLVIAGLQRLIDKRITLSSYPVNRKGKVSRCEIKLLFSTGCTIKGRGLELFVGPLLSGCFALILS